MRSDEQGVRWSVDSLVLREGSLFAYGWCADPRVPIVKLDLLLEYDSGRRETVPAQYGTNRADVAASHSNLPSACGYFAYASLMQNEHVRNVWLRLHRADGSHLSLACPVPEQAGLRRSESMGQTAQQWRLLLGYCVRGLRMLGRGQWRTAWHRAAGVRKFLHSRAGDGDTLHGVFSSLRPGAVLVLDHSLGGGANKFCAELVQSFQASGRDVIVWVFTPYLLRHEIAIHHGSGAPVRKFHLAWEKWELLLASGKVSEAVFNNCVGFPRQEQVPAMLAAFRQVGGARLRVYLHDFHMVCPSHFLLSHEGKFCGVPDVAQCRRCLPQVDDGLAALFVARDIDLWRQRWREMLEVADEIIYFSSSSRELLARAYPDIREEQWVFRPHRMPQPVGRFVYPRQKAGLRVAVVGQIGVHKGSDVVLALRDEARRQKVDLHLVVVGTLDTQASAHGLTQTGPYRPENLGSLLNEHGVHMALMPSIWAETFSYVTHELIDLRVPVLAFDFGAQAEAVSAYARGRVIPFGDAPALLRQIEDFKGVLDAMDLS